MTGVLAMTSSDRVLVIAPHQDDESIGCGGALLRWRKENAHTGVVWLSATTDGERIGVEAKTAAARLGLDWTKGIGQPPIGLTDDTQTINVIVAALREFKPTVLLLPHRDEDDRQHHVTSKLAYEAEWIAAYEVHQHLGAPVRRPRLVLGYEVWTPLRRPTTYLDITEFTEEKRAVISCYDSQEKINKFSDAALALNRYHGAMSGLGEYVEAYQILRAM